MARKSMNVAELAEAAGLSQGTIYGIRYAKSCKLKTIAKLANALSVDPSELIETVPHNSVRKEGDHAER